MEKNNKIIKRFTPFEKSDKSCRGALDLHPTETTIFDELDGLDLIQFNSLHT
jgi:hypothetical protein